MDRNTVLAIALSSLVMLVWLYWFSPPPTPVENTSPDTDSTVVETQPTTIETPETIPSLVETPVLAPDSLVNEILSGDAKNILVENNLYKATFSTKGASLLSFELKTFTDYDQKTPVQLVSSTKDGALGLEFLTNWNRAIDTRALYFETSFTDTKLTVDSPQELVFFVPMGKGLLKYIYSFKPNSYEVRLKVETQNSSDFMASQGYDLVWYGGIPFSEENIQQSAEGALANARSGGDIVRFDAKDGSSVLSGKVDWVSVKNRFFTSVIMPQSETQSAEMEGEVLGEDGKEGYFEDYLLRLELARPQEADEFVLYLGPIDVAQLDNYGDLDLYGVIDFGFMGGISKFVSHYIIVPTFNFLSSFIPNYGIIILIFALLVKIVLYPLTKSSFKSMAKMRQLQPKMQEIQAKYKDNPQKQQEAMMKMYREGGANPLGGCLPMLLQFPILIAMWRFFPNSIEIRQKGFLWSSDLSAPDVLFNLPFEIPFYGDFVSGFTLLMGISMVIQMQIQGGDATGAGNPAMKYMKYIMPIFIVFLFNTWAGGLNLYYLAYNVLTAIQQRYINTHLEKEGIIEPKNTKGVKSKAPKTVQRTASKRNKNK